MVRVKREYQESSIDAFLEFAARAELNQSLDDNENEDETEFPGLHYPLDYMVDTWLDHRKYGKYPESGSYNDQDPLWWADMRLMTMRFNRWIRRLQKEDGDGDVVDKLTGGTQGTHWNNLVGD